MTRPRLLWATLSLFAALAQFRLILFVLGDNYARSADAAWRVTTGHPDWRGVQSRVLGPWLIRAIAWPFGPSGSEQTYLWAHVAFSIITLSIAGYLAWRIAGVLGFAIMHAAFALMLSAPWLYAWDYLDLIIFLAFVWMAIERRPVGAFLALFAVAIWNRDSAEFIALFLVIHGAIRRNLYIATWGVLAGIVGIGLMQLLRHVLLVQEMGPLIFSDVPKTGNGANAFFGWNLWLNFGRTFRIDPSLPFMPALFTLGLAGCCLWWAWRARAAHRSMWLTFGAMAVAVPMFAVMSETRALVYLIPALVARAAI